MIGLSKFITKEFRILLGLTLVFNIAVIYASKLSFHVGLDFDDDFTRYYQNYLDIYDGISGAMFYFGGEFEIGLGVFYKILSILFPKLLPSSVLLFTALSVCLLFYIWLEVYILKYFKAYQRAALVAFCMFLDIFMETIGLTRQCFSTIFLLYAFSSKDWRGRVGFLAIAMIFHISAIFIFTTFYVIKYFPKVSLFLLLCFTLFFMQDSASVNATINGIALFLKGFLPDKAITYFTYYINDAGFTPYYFVYMPIMKFILSLCVLFSIFMLCPKDKILKHFKMYILICFFIYFTHILPSRSVFLLTNMLFYFVVFVSFRRFFNLTLFFFFPYFIFRMYKWLISPDVATDYTSTHLFFWYPESGIYPFYYLFQGVL